MAYDEDYEYEEEVADRSDSYSSVEEEEEEEEEFEESGMDRHTYSQKERAMIEEWLKKNRRDQE